MWKQLIDFPDYEVSDKGKVRNIKRQRELKGTWQHGYHKILLTKDGCRYQRYMHQLVLEAFVGPRPDGMWIRHLDGDPSNNCLDNLAYGTQLENARDRQEHGTYGCKLQEHDVIRIRELHESGTSGIELASMFAVNQSTISRIVRKQQWAYIA